AGCVGAPAIEIRGALVGFAESDRPGTGTLLCNRNLRASLPAGPIVTEPTRFRFPDAVTIRVLAPTPDGGFFALPGEVVRVAEGYLYVAAGDRAVPRSWDFIGGVFDVVLVYVDGDVAPGSMTAAYLGGVLAPGFHLRAWRATAALGPAQ